MTWVKHDFHIGLGLSDCVETTCSACGLNFLTDDPPDKIGSCPQTILKKVKAAMKAKSKHSLR